MTHFIRGIGELTRNLINNPNKKNDNDFDEFLEKLREEKEKPKINQAITTKFSLENIQGDTKTPSAINVEPEEVFQDAWGIDDDLDLDIQKPPEKEKEKEEGSSSKVLSDEGINPFKEIAKKAKKAANIFESFIPGIQVGESSEKADEANEQNQFKEILSKLSQNEEKKESNQSNHRVQHSPDRSKEVKELQEEIANLKQLLHQYMNQAAQVEALARMEQEMRQQEHERKMQELRDREQEITAKEEQLSTKERELNQRERKVILKENINIDENYLETISAEIEDNKAKVQELEEKCALLESQNSQQKEQYEAELERTKTELTQQKEIELNERLSALRTQYETEIKEQQSKHQEEVQRLKSIQENMKTKIKSWANSFKEFKSDIRKKMTEIEELVWDRTEDILNTKAFIQVHSKITEISKAYQSKLASKDQQISKLQEEENKLKGEISKLEQAKKKLISDHEALVKKLQKEKEALEEAFEEEREKTLAVQLKVDEAINREREKDKQIKKLQEEKTQLENEHLKEIKKLKTENYNLEERYLNEIEELKTKQSSDSEVKKKYQELKAQLEEVQKEKNKMVNDFNKEKAILKDEYEEKFRSLNLYIEQLYTKNHELSDENNKMNTKFSKLKEKLAFLDSSFKNLSIHSSVASPRTEIKQFLANFNFLSGNSSNATPEKTEEKEEPPALEETTDKGIKEVDENPEVREFTVTQDKSQDKSDIVERELLADMGAPTFGTSGKTIERPLKVHIPKFGGEKVEEQNNEEKSNLEENQPAEPQPNFGVQGSPQEEKSEKAPSLKDIPPETVGLKLDQDSGLDIEEGWGNEDIDLGLESERKEADKPPSFSDLDSPRRTTSARERQRDRMDSNASFSHDNTPTQINEEDKAESPKFENESPKFEIPANESPIKKSGPESPKFETQESPKFERPENTSQDRNLSRSVELKRQITNDSFSNIEDPGTTEGWDVDIDLSIQKDQKDNSRHGNNSPKFESIKESPGFGTQEPPEFPDLKITKPIHFTSEKNERRHHDELFADEPNFGGRRRSPSFSNTEDEEVRKAKHQESPTFIQKAQDPQSPDFKNKEGDQVESPSFEKKTSSPDKGKALVQNTNGWGDLDFDLPPPEQPKTSILSLKPMSNSSPKPEARTHDDELFNTVQPATQNIIIQKEEKNGWDLDIIDFEQPKSDKSNPLTKKSDSHGWGSDDIILTSQPDNSPPKHLPTFGSPDKKPVEVRTSNEVRTSKEVSISSDKNKVSFDKSQSFSSQGSMEKKSKPPLTINKGLIINTGLIKPGAGSNVKPGLTTMKSNITDLDVDEFFNQ